MSDLHSCRIAGKSTWHNKKKGNKKMKEREREIQREEKEKKNSV